MIEQADVVIIGGGVNGASIAYHLAARQYGTIVLVEKSGLADGSSGKSGGIIRQHYSNPALIRMAIESRRFFERFDAEVDGHAGFVQNGFLIVVAEKETAALKANVTLQRELGLDVELVAPAQVGTILPGINTDGVALAAYERSAGYADPYGVVTAFAQRAKQSGVTIHIGRQVTGIHVQDGAVRGVETNLGLIRTPLVVNAAGPWGRHIARMVGIDLPLTVKRLQELVVKPPTAYSKMNPTVIDLCHLVYFRPEPGGLVLAGGGITDDPEPVDPDRYKGADFETLSDVSERLTRRMPGLADAELIRGWAGVITVTPDFHPILGEAPEVQGFIHAMSCSGHGFKLAPIVGRLIAELIVDGHTTTLDITPLRPDRFQQGRALRSRYEDFPILA
ncbi:MAG: FAD-binding oxidoreductase [Candidatus Latescibacteria bacterium]|nr:FAD-binding oxidoreductase [Candidatus Latescibacterota bacterium]